MPPLNPFRLERYFARYEFTAPYLLSPSDCESLRLAELLALADPETAALWEQLSLGYTETPGHPLLRAEIAGLYDSTGAQDTLVMAPQEAIFIAMHTLLSPGDEVIALHPAYQSLHEVARSIGCRVVPWALVPGEQGWQLDLDALEGSLTGRTRLLVVNFPHNPTGFLPTRAELDAVVAFARGREIILFSDEMYRLLEYRPQDRLPAVCDLYERGVSLSGMSKAFSLPGLRIGWLAAREPGLVERWQEYKDYTTMCSSAPSEVLAMMALRAREAILDRNRVIIQANLAAAGEFFARHPERFKWLPPLAGSVAFPEWTGPGSVEAFCQLAVEREGVMVVPGSMFDAPGSHFRLGLGRRNFPEALARVERLLDGS